MAQFVLSPEALNDLREIRDYIARGSGEAARRGPDRSPLEVVRVLSGYRDIAELLS